jgi:hypothetical protein
VYAWQDGYPLNDFAGLYFLPFLHSALCQRQLEHPNGDLRTAAGAFDELGLAVAITLFSY